MSKNMNKYILVICQLLFLISLSAQEDTAKLEISYVMNPKIYGKIDYIHFTDPNSSKVMKRFDVDALNPYLEQYEVIEKSAYAEYRLKPRLDDPIILKNTGSVAAANDTSYWMRTYSTVYTTENGAATHPSIVHILEVYKGFDVEDGPYVGDATIVVLNKQTGQQLTRVNTSAIPNAASASDTHLGFAKSDGSKFEIYQHKNAELVFEYQALPEEVIDPISELKGNFIIESKIGFMAGQRQCKVLFFDPSSATSFLKVFKENERRPYYFQYLPTAIKVWDLTQKPRKLVRTLSYEQDFQLEKNSKYSTN